MCPQIESLRQRFDWLHPHIAAHMTLVFPFDMAEVSDADLIQHCGNIAEGFESFAVSLLPPELSEDDHGWLPIAPHAGLAELASHLHSGPLAALAATRREFRPHITLARPRLATEASAEITAAWPAAPVTLAVESLTPEAILPDHSSKILGRFSLRPRAGQR